MVPHAPTRPPDDLRQEGGTSFHALYNEHFPFVWRCLRGLGVPESSLDDAAQEVFVIVHRRLGEFRGEASFRTWLYAIVRRVAANQRRGERRRGPTLAGNPEAAGETRDPVLALEDREAMRLVGDFVAGLDVKKRDVFVLALLEGLSIPEVSEILAVPLNTAYTRLRSVRSELARAVERRRGTP